MPSASGPRVARVYQKLLALVFLIAWVSLGVQVHVLVGSRGLLPIEDVARALATRPDVSFADFPSLLRYSFTDDTLTRGVWLGIALAVLAFFGVFPRILFGASTFLYLSYTVAARDFLSFQWDNLLLECGALAVFLPANRAAPWAHLLARLALFKLYFESGIAKYQSYIGDWKDGSAMAYYYETAPIPTRLAWYAHHLPPFWHKLESWGTLAFELGCPLLIFLPRAGRLTALLVFTTFQVANILTANYGFFSYLALVLGVFLLDDSDVERTARRTSAAIRALVRRLPNEGRSVRVLAVRARLAARALRTKRRRSLSRAWGPARSVRDRWLTPDRRQLLGRARSAGGLAIVLLYAGVSAQEGLDNFWREGPKSDTLAALAAAIEPFRVVNTYHLFGSITRERIEPTFETYDGHDWVEHDFRYKAGPLTRPPPFVAPHQPRVDFLLWFYGLSYERGVPLYVQRLLLRLCRDPLAVEPLFVAPLGDAPLAVRVSFYQYHFTTPDERRANGAYWSRAPVGAPRGMRCEEPRPR